MVTDIAFHISHVRLYYIFESRDDLFQLSLLFTWTLVDNEKSLGGGKNEVPEMLSKWEL